MHALPPLILYTEFVVPYHLTTVAPLHQMRGQNILMGAIAPSRRLRKPIVWVWDYMLPVGSTGKASGQVSGIKA